MQFFKRKSREKQNDQLISQAEFDNIQKENDQLLDQVEELKLDLAELQVEKERVETKLLQSGFRKKLTKTAIGLSVLIVSYLFLHFLNEDPQYKVVLLLIEAAFMFMMLQGDDK